MIQDLGPAPSRAADLVTKAYADGLGGSAAYRTTNSGGSTISWARIARLTLGVQFAGVTATLLLQGTVVAADLVETAEIKVRANQKAAFGSAPVADVVVSQSTTIQPANVGYVIVSNAGPSIVDIYVQIPLGSLHYFIAPQGTAVSGGGSSIVYVNQEALSTSAPSGLVAGSASTQNHFQNAEGTVDGATKAYYTLTERAKLAGVATGATAYTNATALANRLDQFAAPTAAINVNSQRITNLAAPTTTTDAARRLDADKTFGTVQPPNVGWIASAPGIVNYSTGNPTAGRVEFQPYFVGPVGWTADAITVRVASAQSGGATSFTAALYADDGTGYPDTSAILGQTGAYTLTTAANVTVAMGAAVVLKPGLYWVATLYNVTTTPTSSVMFTTISASMFSFAQSATTNLGTAIRSYQITASAFPTTATAKSGIGIEGNNVTPVVALRRSA